MFGQLAAINARPVAHDVNRQHVLAVIIEEVTAGVNEDTLRRTRACRAGAAETWATPLAQRHSRGEFQSLGAFIPLQRLDQEVALVGRQIAGFGGLVVAALAPVGRAVAKEAATAFAEQ